LAYVRSAEQLLDQLGRGETGAETFEIAGKEYLSVISVAEIVRDAASELQEVDVDIELVENPRDGETMVEEFSVDISKAKEIIGWEPAETVADSVRWLLQWKA
jgi:UDP-glucose 4-epimerase